MKEVGADISASSKFIYAVQEKSINEALAMPGVPSPSRMFTSTTFQFIENNKPH